MSSYSNATQRRLLAGLDHKTRRAILVSGQINMDGMQQVLKQLRLPVTQSWCKGLQSIVTSFIHGCKDVKKILPLFAPKYQGRMVTGGGQRNWPKMQRVLREAGLTVKAGEHAWDRGAAALATKFDARARAAPARRPPAQRNDADESKLESSRRARRLSSLLPEDILHLIHRMLPPADVSAANWSQLFPPAASRCSELTHQYKRCTKECEQECLLRGCLVVQKAIEKAISKKFTAIRVGIVKPNGTAVYRNLIHLCELAKDFQSGDSLEITVQRTGKVGCLFRLLNKPLSRGSFLIVKRVRTGRFDTNFRKRARPPCNLSATAFVTLGLKEMSATPARRQQPQPQKRQQQRPKRRRPQRPKH